MANHSQKIYSLQICWFPTGNSSSLRLIYMESIWHRFSYMGQAVYCKAHGSLSWRLGQYYMEKQRHFGNGLMGHDSFQVGIIMPWWWAHGCFSLKSLGDAHCDCCLWKVWKTHASLLLTSCILVNNRALLWCISLKSWSKRDPNQLFWIICVIPAKL